MWIYLFTLVGHSRRTNCVSFANRLMTGLSHLQAQCVTLAFAKPCFSNSQERLCFGIIVKANDNC